jgi:hypothetical protein
MSTVLGIKLKNIAIYSWRHKSSRASERLQYT